MFGITLEQGYNDAEIESLLANIVTANSTRPPQARDLMVADHAEIHAVNSVCFVKDGQVIGNGVGQQSRVHCTRLAGNKADLWHSGSMKRR